MPRLSLLVVLGLLWMPAAVYGQAAIAGAVRSATGEPLPDVVVDAASPSLIEKVRSATTDSAGRYRIEDLRPGTYTVTFRLGGWTSAQTHSIVLTGSFTATLDAQLTVGTDAEAITVTRETVVVDVQNAGRELTLPGETVKLLPTARSYGALLALVPGVVTSTNDVVTGTATTSFPMHGGRTNEGRLMLDGFTVGSPPNGNSAASYVIDTGSADEITFTISGLGEQETAGLVMNVVDKSGGNAHHGSLFASGSSEHFQSSNLTPELRARGATATTPLSKVYDVSGTFGGPLVRDRLWYFLKGHVGGSTKENSSVYYNLNAGDPAVWFYAPDRMRREYSDRTFEDASARFTWHLTPRQTISAIWDAQALCRTCTGATPGLSEPQRIAPEAVGVLGRPLHVAQATWSSPVTGRLLLEAGFGGTYFGVGNFERSPNPTRDLIRVVEQCASGCAANGGIPGLVYRSQDFSVAYAGSYLWQGSASYVTGGHSLKVGYQHTFMTDNRTWMTNDQNLTYRVNNGVPNQLTESISPWVNNARAAWDGLFVQDQWTHKRLTLQGALRFDRSSSWFPAQQEGPSRFLPAPIVIPETRGIDSYKDLTVRMGASYDVSGEGRTVVKATLGKYLEGAGITGNYANTNPTLRLPQTTSVFGTAGVTRAWTDANHNLIADCDLLNPAAQDLRASGGDACGVVSNTSFGRNVLTNNFDSALLHGWGVRPSDWMLNASLQQRLGATSVLDVTYIRRWFHGFSVVDNLAVQPSDLTPFSITAPLDARLPGGGGYAVSGLYDVVPGKAGVVDNLVADSGKYGAWTQRFDGLDVALNARAGSHFTFIGGASVGRTVADNCDVRAHLPELSTAVTGTSPFGAGLATTAVTPLGPYCDVNYGIQTQFRGLSTYEVPRIGILLSGTLQNKPGAMLAANYAVPNAEIVPSLGRPLSGNAVNATVNLIAPGTRYGDRINELDVRIGKTLQLAGARTLLAVDVYNALNSSAVLTYDNTFVPGGAWLQPTTILTPRFFKITAQIDF
jgi:hypothetical protein